MTTKEQERKALEQIKKILAGLEEDSYVATAMRGMVEDAEENIENDFALSRYDAWQDAEFRADCLAQELKEAQEKIAKLEELKKAILSSSENDLIRQSLIDYRFYLSNENQKAAEEIVKYADNTDVEEFKQAVYTHRSTEKKLAVTQGLVRTLREVDDAKLDWEIANK